MTSANNLRIAFFITSYGSGEQLYRLVKTLRDAEPDSPIVVHHDVFQTKINRAQYEEMSGIHILSSDKPIVWGDMTLEAARWRVFRWILQELDVDWVVLLSEQDYPIAPLAKLRSRLSGDGIDAVIQGEIVNEMKDEALRHECEIRYLYGYASFFSLGIERKLPVSLRRTLAHWRGLAITAVTRLQKQIFIYTTSEALNLPSRIGVRRRKTPFDSNFPLWYNDCWMALSKKALLRIVEYLDAHPEYIRYYTRTIIPLESATATIVFNDPELTVDNAPLHAIRWTSPTSGRPDVFELKDLDYLVSSGLPFARKFDPKNDVLLDELDKIVFQRSKEAS